MKRILCFIFAVLFLSSTCLFQVNVAAFPLQAGYIQPQSISNQVYSWDRVATSKVQKNPKDDSEKNPANTVSNTITKYAAQVKQTIAKNLPSISIPAINIYNRSLDYGTINDLSNLDKRLLYNPVVESQSSADLCTLQKNSYIVGHSEPAIASTSGYPGVYVFSDLNQLNPGDIINVTNQNGASCSYKVTNWEKVVTNSQDQVPLSVFNNLYNPNTGGKSTLTIQTCQKGSASVRLILRAEMV